MNGLSPKRTSRIIGLLLGFVGFILLAISSALLFILSYAQTTLLAKANGMIKDGLALYNSFTGRLAVENISGHKELLAQLHTMKELLPSEDLISTGEMAGALLLVVAVAFLVLGAVGIFLPQNFVSGLTKVGLLKWNESDDSKKDKPGFWSRRTRKQKCLILGIPSGTLLLVVFIVWIVSLVGPSVETASRELEIHALEYLNSQKDYYAKHKVIGNASKLELKDSTSTEYFNFVVSSSKFTATSLMEIEGCPEGSSWTISARQEGLFTKELKLYRKAPADANCEKIMPDFKSLGKRKK